MLLDGQQEGHRAICKLPLQTSFGWQLMLVGSVVGTARRASACPVKTLRIRVTGDWESMAVKMVGVYLENGH